MRDLKGQTDGGERWKTFYAEETECMKYNIKKNGYLQIIPFTGMRCVGGGGGDCMY